MLLYLHIKLRFEEALYHGKMSLISFKAFSFFCSFILWPSLSVLPQALIY